MSQLKFVSLSKTFSSGSEKVPVLQHFNWEVSKGDFITILGSNGSGKSTLLNLISGKIQPDSGKILLDQSEIQNIPEYQRSKWIARVFQDPFQGTASELSILENFRLAAVRNNFKGLGIHTGKEFQEVVHSKVKLLQLGLENKLEKRMGLLSGGQRQALTLLMVTMTDAKLVLMDEPTAALDPKTSKLIMEFAQQFHEEMGWTTLMVTHQLKDAKFFGDRMVMMKGGKIFKDIHGEEKKSIELTEIVNWFD